jgi:N-acetylglucosamine kinase-like BadF-type ATPase
MGERLPGGQSWYVGVDGGGTKTYAVVTDTSFHEVGEGRAGPSNFLRAGLEPAVHAVERAVCLACLDAGVRLRDVRAAGFGLAGVHHPKHHAAMYRALRSRFPFRSIMLTTDARAAVAGATDLRPGVVVISGTGSVAFGVDAHGRMAQSGGWGPVMGDEGSGTDIARRALAAVAGSADGRLPPTTLVERVCRRFGVASPEDLLTVVYDPARDKRAELADLPVIVEAAARSGDAVAQSILADAGRDLAATVVAVVRRLGLEAEPVPVAYVGGVFGAGELVLGPLGDAVRRAVPLAEIAPPLYGPAVGAAKLAVHGARHDVARPPADFEAAPMPGGR